MKVNFIRDVKLRDLKMLLNDERITQDNSKVDWNNTYEAYDAVAATARALMVQKNHDYGDSWRLMRSTSITDQIRVKIMRIIELEGLEASGSAPKVSEGIESEFRDILNYAAFSLIKIEEAKKTKNKEG